jgi:uridine kinase
MSMVIDIRGTHGSGKSYIPNRILDSFECLEVWGKPLTYEGRAGILGYEVPELNVFLLGSYESRSGGCDAVRTQDEIKARVLKFMPHHHVLLEGILVAHTYKPWSVFATGKPWRFVFLDTPLEKCLARVDARRAEVGKGPIEDSSNIVRDWGRILQMHEKFLADGHSSELVPHETAYDTVIDMLRGQYAKV